MEDASMVPSRGSRRAAAVIAAGLACMGVDALELNVSETALRRAISLAGGDSAALAAFHRPYVIAVGKSDIHEVEVITEFRRAVSAARPRVGEPQYAAAQRLEQTLAPFRRRVSIVAHVRLSPQTALVSLPPYEVSIASMPGAPEIRPLDVRRTPIYAGGGGRTSLSGGDIDAVFDASEIGQAKRRVVIGLRQKELVAVSIDFSAIE
jgi:hypothetical protein